jgi:phosphoribosylaminoimidazole (AIR) synthetase
MSQIYKESGVDLDAGNSISAFAGKVSAKSWENSGYVHVFDHTRGNFRGPRTFLTKNLPKGTELILGTDGIGTKTGLITEAMSHLQAATDLVAMLGGDHTRWGAMPIILSNLLDASSLGTPGTPAFEDFMHLFEGLGESAKKEQVVLLGGETAELGNFVGSDNPNAVTKFNWAGFMLGAYHRRAAITGEYISPGQLVVALREYGFRSNGMSAVRKKAFRHRFGSFWWNNPQAVDAIKKAATPSVLYDQFLVTANGWKSPHFGKRIPVSGIAHLTGGGIPEKFGGLLFPTGYSAELPDLWEPPEIMKKCAKWLREGERNRVVTDEELYRTWNGGQGALVILNETDVPRFRALATQFGIETKVCGQIVPSDGKPSIRIHSKFGSDEWITFS